MEITLNRKHTIDQIEWVTTEFEWPEVMRKEWVSFLRSKNIQKLKDLESLSMKELNEIYGEAYTLLT
jgi:hypothetical protein